jgi:hypothetical protein
MCSKCTFIFRVVRLCATLCKHSPVGARHVDVMHDVLKERFLNASCRRHSHLTTVLSCDTTCDGRTTKPSWPLRRMSHFLVPAVTMSSPSRRYRAC